MIDQTKRLREMVRKGRNKPPVKGENRSASLKHSQQVKRCTSIAVTSGKGGVGKSNITLSLAVSLTLLGKKVLVLDGDLGLANLHILLGINPRYNLFHVVQEECTINDVLCSGPSGITLIPGSSGLLSMANLESVRLEMLMRNFAQLESGFDFLLIDGGAGIAQSSIQLSTSADSVLLVITPEPTSLADAYATAKILLQKGMKNISILVNMATSDRDGKDIYLKLHSLITKFLDLQVTLIGILPYDKNVSKCIRNQQNIVVEKNQSLFTMRMYSIAQNLVGMKSKKMRNFFTQFVRSQLLKD